MNATAATLRRVSAIKETKTTNKYAAIASKRSIRIHKKNSTWVIRRYHILSIFAESAENWAAFVANILNKQC